MRTPISRIELLQVLESVSPGLAPGNSVEQADCFAFKSGRVATFDGEILCRSKTNLPIAIKGAVHGKPLLEALRKLEIDDVEVAIEGSEFIVAGKRDEIRVRVDPNIQLPTASVERAEEYTDLPPEFGEAIDMVVECAGKDEQEFILTCIHIHPKWVEACDSTRFSRYKTASNIKVPSLLRAKAAKSLATRGPTKLGETKNWLHFRNGTGLTISICRFDPAEYNGAILERLTELTKGRGTPVPFPKSIVPAAELAEIFSKEESDNNVLNVNLKPGKVIVTGLGISGRASHRSKIRYDGPELTFTVGPKVLQALIEKHDAIEIEPGQRLIVSSGRWYFTCKITEVKEKVDG